MDALTADVNLAWLGSEIAENFIVLDLDARVRFINRTVPGITPEQVVGQSLYELVGQEFHEQVATCLETVRSTSQPSDYETRYKSPLGDETVWESRVGPLLRAGKLEGFLVVSINASERGAAVAHRQLFNRSADLLCVATADGYFHSVNPRFLEVLGFTSEQLTKRPFLDFVHPDDQANSLAVIQTLQTGAAVLDFENRYRTASGDYRVLAWHGVPDLKLGLIFANARDVTERRALEDRIRRTQRFELLGQLAGGIAHDFNNMLLAIGSHAHLARIAPGKGEQDKAMAQIEVAVQRATALTKNLLMFSRSEAVELVPTQLADVVTDLGEVLRRVLPANVRLICDVHSGLPSIDGDRSQVDQVLLNLLINARDSMPDGGTIEVRCESVPDWTLEGSSHKGGLRLTVADSGVGMDATTRDRAFEPFFTTKGNEGTGLGLATVLSVVQRHKGQVTLSSELGKGTTVVVHFPVRAKTSAPSQAAPARPVILVAEDAEPVRRVVVRVLEKAGYELLVAEDGAAALDLIDAYEGRLDAAVLDVMMPRKTGPETAAELRKRFPALPVVLMSGYSEPDLLSQFGFGRDDVLRKPFRTEQLLQNLAEKLVSAGATGQGETSS